MTKGTDVAFASQALLAVQRALEAGGPADATPACKIQIAAANDARFRFVALADSPETAPGDSAPLESPTS